MSLVTAIIIDDEAHNISVLKTLLNKHCPLINIVAEAASADEGFQKINSFHPQLIFLDIRMPGKSGFDLLKLFNTIEFEVIFVSAFNEYAITAFEFNALGYILKPIDFSKLISSVNKAIEKINVEEKNDSVLHFIKTLEDKNDLINKVSIHQNEKVALINISEIISVEAKSELCELKLVDGMSHYSSKDLKLFEDMLEKIGNFIRVNRGAVININHIKGYSKGDTCTLQMINNSEFEVSRRKKTDVLRRVKFI